MKKILIHLFTGVLFSGSVYAQTDLFLEEQEVNLPDGKVNGWVFPASGDREEIQDDIKQYLKERSDLKLKKEGDNMLIARKVSLPAISTMRGDLIGYCQSTGQVCTMAIIFKLGYDISLSTKDWETEMENLRHYVKAFMTYHYEQVYAGRIKSLEKQLKTVVKERDQTEKKIENLTGKINNTSKKIGKETETAKIDAYQAEINTLESDIRQLMDTLPGLESEIEALNSEVSKNKVESNACLSTIATL